MVSVACIEFHQFSQYKRKSDSSKPLRIMNVRSHKAAQHVTWRRQEFLRVSHFAFVSNNHNMHLLVFALSRC